VGGGEQDAAAAPAGLFEVLESAKDTRKSREGDQQVGRKFSDDCEPAHPLL